VAREQFNTKKRKGFLLAVISIFVIALLVVSHVTLGNPVSDEELQYSSWPASMLFMEGARIVVYSTVFTLLCAIPLRVIFRDTDKSS